MHSAVLGKILKGGACAALLSWPSTALACGGFFCSQSAPVNQAAERIIFSDNGDETVTAVIQIMYEGPAENFSWLLPISTVPTQDEDIVIASNLAFARLQNATNPSYNLTTRVEGTCAGFNGGSGGASASAGPPTATPGGNDMGGGVMIEASGIVGSFEWTVISLDRSLEDRAEVAVLWLQENGYDVPEGARGLIRPYLEDGLYLLALRLTKGADSGSIRPIALTYDAKQPMIPIKLTAVAANEDMGVMTWLLSSARGVPENYYSLELNEAKINWFNASSNYNDVVTAAADEAGGQGFVTEFADATSTLAETVWSSSDEQLWQSFKTGMFANFGEILDTSNAYWGSWDGFWDAVRASVTLPDSVSMDDFKLCPSCYSDQIQFSPSGYVQALESNVIEPVRWVQELIDSRPYVTRLYTTLSAEEMTTDPVFTFNPDLEPVSNIHSAERIIECNPSITTFEAPWRIELPQGGEIRGTGAQVGTWPAATDEQPSNLRITRLSATGSGRVHEDNSDEIQSQLEAYNRSLADSSGTGGSGTGGSGTGGSGTGGSGTGGSRATAGSSATSPGESGMAGASEAPPKPRGGCAVAPGSTAEAGGLALAFALFGWIRRQRSRVVRR